MADHEPTLGEIYRLQLATQASIDRLTADMRADRDHAANTYVRKDVNDATVREIRDDITELKDNWKGQKGRNQQIVIGVVIGFIVLILGMVATALGMPGGTA